MVHGDDLEQAICGLVAFSRAPNTHGGWSATVSNKPAAPKSGRSFLSQAAEIQWSELHPVAAAVSSVAVAVCVFGGLIAGSGQIGMAATTGALPTGFGAFQRLSSLGLRAAPMLLAAVGMALCGFLGALLGRSMLLSAMVGGLIAAICGLATQYGQAPWWFTLQWSIAFFLAGATPSDFRDAVHRGLLILGGAGLQIAIIVAAWAWHPFGAASESQRASETPPPIGQLFPSWLQLRYALAIGVMVTVALTLEHATQIQNGYWVPMTALIIVKPSGHDTLVRTVQRVLGTLIGCAAATGIAALLRPTPAALAIGVTVLAWCTYAMQRASYAAFSLWITATVVFMMSLAGLPEPEAAGRRVIATLMGAALAVIAGFVATPRGSPSGGSD
jgi:hypothetical protein